MLPLLWCLDNNQPLSAFRDAPSEPTYRYGGFGMNGGALCEPKRLDRMARALVNGLTQDDVVRELAREWNDLGSLLRVRITTIANEPGHSGNVRKGIARLDSILGGKVKRHPIMSTERVLVERDGATGVAYRRAPAAAVLGASQAYADFVLPPGYEQWPPAKKKRYRQEEARRRRSNKTLPGGSK